MPTLSIDRCIFRLLAGLSIILLSVMPSVAGGLAPPSGQVLLTVTGEITRTNRGDRAEFDRAMLDAMPQHSFTTSTIWTEGKSTYQGVLLKDLLAEVGADGGSVVARALNDYQVNIPFADVSDEAPLVAYLADGAPMPIRERGPLWVIYPYDDDADYQTEQIYARSIWQLEMIVVED